MGRIEQMTDRTDDQQWSAINKLREKIAEHEAGCEGRHARIDARFDSIEAKLDELAGKRRDWLYIAGMIAGPISAVVAAHYLG